MDRRPVLVIGEEEFASEQEVARLVAEALPPESRSLNLDVLDGGMPVGELLARLDTAPFFGPCRVVVVRRLETMREADQEALVAYLERGGSPTVGLFVARDLDRRRRLFQAFRRLGTIIECRPLSHRELPGWVTRRFAAAGKRADAAAADGLVALVGGSLRDLAHEVDKVAAYVGDQHRVTKADVEAIASRLTEVSIFRLVDQVGGGEAAGALRSLHEILATHQPLQVLAMVARQFRLILRAHALVGEGLAPGALAERLGVPPFVAPKIAGQARRFGAEQFPGIFRALEEADRAIKSGGPPELVLETLFVRLGRAGQAPHQA